ncbi:hypothetical protein D3C76_952950 [compost metagenome]
MMQAFAKGPVADLVVVLQKQDERAGWQVPAGFATGLAVTVDVTLEHQALAQAAGQLFGRVLRIISVVGVGFAGQQHVQGIVAIVVPLRVEILFQQAGLVVFVFHHQPDMA